MSLAQGSRAAHAAQLCGIGASTSSNRRTSSSSTSIVSGSSLSPARRCGAQAPVIGRCQGLRGAVQGLPGVHPPSAGGRGHPMRRHTRGVPGRAVALFTGIVEEMGRVLRLEEVPEGEGAQAGWVLEVQGQETLQGTQLGDSIAVNGTCLTVTSFVPASSSFTFGLSPETLRCTSLGELQQGSAVNLERSLRPDSRMGGHFVQGHVDATGTIKEFWEEGDSLWVRVNAPKDLMPYIVPKGFIAIDGTSLTVVDVDDKDCSFTFMLVAYTQQKIVVPNKPVGSKVNLEVDILGKYVRRMLDSLKAQAS